MVRRELDVTVACPALGLATAAAVGQIGVRPGLHPRVWQFQFRDDTGEWNTDPATPTACTSASGIDGADTSRILKSQGLLPAASLHKPLD